MMRAQPDGRAGSRLFLSSNRAHVVFRAVPGTNLANFFCDFKLSQFKKVSYESDSIHLTRVECLKCSWQSPIIQMVPIGAV